MSCSSGAAAPTSGVNCVPHSSSGLNPCQPLNSITMIAACRVRPMSAAIARSASPASSCRGTASLTAAPSRRGVSVMPPCVPFALLPAELYGYAGVCRALGELGLERALQLQQPALALQPATVAAEGAAGAQHAVAWDHDRDRVRAERVAGRARATRAAGLRRHLDVA